MSVMDLFSLKGKKRPCHRRKQGSWRRNNKGLVDAGAVAVVSSRNQADCDKAAKEIMEKTGGVCYGISGDISTKERR